MAGYRIIRAGDRFVSAEPGVVSRHSFSFGRHYDPGNVSFGLLLMNNDDVVEPGSGYPTHPHREVEIVTWVLEGALVHVDSTGAGGVIYPGLAQRLSAGRGVLHSETNGRPAHDPSRVVRPDRRSVPAQALVRPDNVEGAEHTRAPLRFVQMWVPPDEAGADPSYAQQDVAAELTSGRLVTVASGMRRHADITAIRLGQRAASMHVARLATGASMPAQRAQAYAVTLPTAPFVHVYVTRGAVDVEGIGRLAEGDAVRITDEGGRRVSAHAQAEIIAWEMHAPPA